MGGTLVFPVKWSQLHFDADSRSFTAEASDLGLAPGEWPDFIAALNERDSGMLFLRGRELSENGDLRGFVYTTLGGFRLTVFND